MIDLNRVKNRKKRIVCHYWYFNNLFKIKKSVCSICCDIVMISPNISKIAIITVRRISYRCLIIALASLVRKF